MSSKRFLSAMLALCATAAFAQTIQKQLHPYYDAAKDTLIKWSNARDAGRLNKEFIYATHQNTGAAMDWAFSPREGTRFNDLFIYREIQTPFSAINVTVANPGAPFNICAKISDGSGAEWVTTQTPIASSQEDITVSMPWNTWRLASWTSRKSGDMVFPLSYFCVIAFGIKGDEKYNLLIKKIDIQTTTVPVLAVEGFQFPDKVDADKQYDLPDFTVTLGEKLNQPTASLRLTRDFTTHEKVPLKVVKQDGKVLSLQAETKLPIDWLRRSGDYNLDFHVIGTHDDGQANVSASKTLKTVNVIQINSNKQGIKAEVKKHNGVPTLFVDGVPHSGMSAAAYGPSLEKFQSFTMADVDLFTFCATPTEGHPGLTKTTWTARDTFDYSQLEQRVAMVLKANPKAKIFPRLYLHAPAWWSEENPDDVVIVEKPDGKRYPFLHKGFRKAPSWVSKKWREDTANALRRLVEYIETSPYADNFVGYHLASGTTEEWMMWGSNENEWVDYSPANIACFRQWLKRKYQTDANLQKAWNNTNVTLENAQLPSYAQRAAAEIGSFKNPLTEMQSIDFCLYNSWLVADTINYFAKVVKDATNRRKTVGVFYGYLLQLGGGHRIHNSGHLALYDVLTSPDIDFVCSPTSYAFRQFGGKGTTHFMSLVDSIRLHGKLWFDENDVRTSISPGSLGTWGKPADIKGDKVQQDKELACVLGNGVAQWWFDVGSNRYDEPELRDVVKNLTRVGNEAITLDRTPNTQAAYIIDPLSIPYMKIWDVMGSEQLLSRLPTLHRGGFPFAHYLVNDLPKIQDHRLLVVPVSFNPDDTQRKNLDAFKADNKVIVFFNGAGAFSNNTFSPDNIKSFTGINMKQDATPLAGSATFTDAEGFCDNLAGKVFGNNRINLNPALVPDDQDAIVLATFADGRPAIVAKRFPNWTAVYCSQPQVPAQFWRNLAKLANIHTYVDTEDVVYANTSMVCVVSEMAGPKTIRLPKPAIVTEMIENKPVTTEPVSSFTFDFREHQTGIFKLQFK